ncbi:MAG TPA: class I SAM-dependent methyltransferase [Candidatus Paceibacterota bacterium]|nr:class I SAM-dependent methyltransferase [Candidatus Paceibacterota bacterium]
MNKETINNQKATNEVWAEVWRKFPDTLSGKELFGQRLFVEGYPIFSRYLPSNKSSKVLDIGSGTGRYGLKMALTDKSRLVYLVDILPESVEMMKRSAAYLNIENVVVKMSDIYKLPFPDSFFDVVFCDVVIQHIDKPEEALIELKRVLKKEGRLIVSVVNWWNLPHTVYKFIKNVFYKSGYEYGYERSYTRRELCRLVKESNLKLVAVDGFYFAYSIFRWKRTHRLWFWLGRIINRLVKIGDTFTGRFISRYFGFEIFFVATKVE